MTITPQNTLRFIVGAAITAFILFFIWYFSSVVIYILVAAVLAIIPGSSSEYDIEFNGDRSSQFDVTLNFEEKEDKALKNFAYVKIVSGDEVLYDKLLADAFDDDTIIIPVDFEKNANTQLKIVYYLPIEVGNEAKNAGAKFDLLFTAQSKEAN